MVDAVAAALLRAQNADGGWGAEEGRRSNTEATALAALALGSAADSVARERGLRGIAWLARLQAADGSWPLSADVTQPSWTTSLAVLALVGLDVERDRAVLGLRWLVGHGGERLGWIASLLYRFWPTALPARMDPDLRGWPWTLGAFSWVEPTAYALLALKKGRAHTAGLPAGERIREAERMISDRMCQGGGWNYGNSNVLGEQIPPYAEVTALTLLALQDRRGSAAHQQSLQALRRMLPEVHSGFALAWAVLCLSVHGEDVAGLRDGLRMAFERTGFLGVTRTLALALLASSERRGVLAL